VEKDAKEKLIEAGERLFAEKGLAGVSIRELSKAAGANSALISYYFGGKEGLYAAILEKQFAPIGELLDAVKGIQTSPTEKIMGYAHNVVLIHKKMPFLTKFLMGELLNPSKFFDPIIRKYIERIYHFMTETLNEGIACGEFREELDVNTATLALAGMMNFYFITRPITRHFALSNSDQDAQYAINAIEIFLSGVKNHDG
jgi:AcrR family transcriptional regulator